MPDCPLCGGPLGATRHEMCGLCEAMVADHDIERLYGVITSHIMGQLDAIERELGVAKRALMLITDGCGRRVQ